MIVIHIFALHIKTFLIYIRGARRSACSMQGGTVWSNVYQYFWEAVLSNVAQTRFLLSPNCNEE